MLVESVEKKAVLPSADSPLAYGMDVFLPGQEGDSLLSVPSEEECGDKSWRRNASEFVLNMIKDQERKIAQEESRIGIKKQTITLDRNYGRTNKNTYLLMREIQLCEAQRTHAILSIQELRRLVCEVHSKESKRVEYQKTANEILSRPAIRAPSLRTNKVQTIRFKKPPIDHHDSSIMRSHSTVIGPTRGKMDSLSLRTCEERPEGRNKKKKKPPLRSLRSVSGMSKESREQVNVIANEKGLAHKRDNRGE
jgi:hypothetical protein